MHDDFEVFDIETTNFKNTLKPILISWTSGSKIETQWFTTEEPERELLDVILMRFKAGGVYYAHNLLFDFSFILRLLIERKIKYNWIFIDYKLFSVTISVGGDNWYLKCSAKLIPWPLAKIASEFKTPPKILFPYEELTVAYLDRGKPISIQDGLSVIRLDLGLGLKLYARRDCLILKQTLTKYIGIVRKLFKRPLDLKKVNSLGGLSLKIFQSGYNKGLMLSMPKAEFLDIKRSYRGGRCEIFGNPISFSNKNIRHFDFESMYHSCLFGDFPKDGLSFVENVGSVDKPGFYHIHIEYFTWLPVLPVKRSKLLFPEGRVVGLFWYEEIEVALQCTDVLSLKINYAWLVNEYVPVLADFARCLKAERRCGLSSKVIKLIVNSFYGRLGMSSDLLRTDIVEQGGVEYGKYGDFLIENTRIQAKNLKANVAVASIITSRARIKLYKALQRVRAIPNARLLYVDTDSIVAEFERADTPDNVQLGEDFKFDTTIKGTCIKDAVFVAPKTYALLLSDGEEVIKVKGAKSEGLSFDQFKGAFYRQERIVVQKASVIRQGLSYIHKVEQIEVVTDSYDKRTWLGLKKTKPLKLRMF